MPSSYPEAQRLVTARVSPELQTWALAECACEESVVQASRDVERSASLARLAQEIAERMRGPESWRHRVQGFATAHAANALLIMVLFPGWTREISWLRASRRRG